MLNSTRFSGMESSKPHTNHSFSLWKKAFFVLLFFLVTPVALGATVLALTSIDSENKDTRVLSATAEALATQTQPGVQVYASLPADIPSVSAEVVAADARVEMIRQYMDEYDSPLSPYAEYIVEMADKYGIDYRLIVAIARKESGMCKVIPPGGHNCWGWGIHSAGTLGFNSFEEGIETVTKGIKENYYDKGYVDPDEIMQKYTPHSPEGIWAVNVQSFIDEME